LWDAGLDVGGEVVVGVDTGTDVPRDVGTDTSIAQSDAATSADAEDVGLVIDVLPPVDVSHLDATTIDATGIDTGIDTGVDTGPTPSATQRSCVAPGVAGCGLADIPGGTFTMGGDSMAFNAETAQAGVTVRAFRLDRYPVTVARFRRFWEANDRPTAAMTVRYQANGTTVQVSVGASQTDVNTLRCSSSFQNWGTVGRDNHPMNCVDWHTAMAFCVWDGGRLPTEAEREWAARATDGRQLPWGGTTQDTARICSSLGSSRSSTCAVDDPAFVTGSSAHSVLHLVGNVRESVVDGWGEYSLTGGANPCANRSFLSNPLCVGAAGVSAYHVFRGGSWGFESASYLRSASRSYGTPSSRFDFSGFRCARDSL